MIQAATRIAKAVSQDSMVIPRKLLSKTVVRDSMGDPLFRVRDAPYIAEPLNDCKKCPHFATLCINR
jgi:hypothetical protein